MNSILTQEEVVALFDQFIGTQNQFIQRVANAFPDIIYVMELENHSLLYSNHIVAVELGYSNEEAKSLENPIMDLIFEEDRQKLLNHLEIVKKSKNGEVIEIEYRLVRRDGKLAWFIDRNTVFTRNSEGKPTTKIGVTHQITKRKELEEQILKQLTIMEQSETITNSGSWEYDPQSRAFSWSDGMYKLFNLPKGMTVQPSVYKEHVIPEDMHIAEIVVKGIEEEQKSFEHEMRIRSNGDIRCLRIKADPVDIEKSNFKKIVGVDLDVSEVIQAHEELKRLNRELEIKSRNLNLLHLDLKTFTQVTASDYSEKLKTIYTLFESIMVNEADKLTNNGKARIRKVQAMLQSLSLITSDILSYISISKNEYLTNTVSLNEVLKQVLYDLEGKIINADAAITVEELGSVRGDFHLLTVLFSHLLNNAIKFRNRDIPTLIKIYSPAPSISETDNKSDRELKYLSVCIIDNGVGFDSSEKEKIYDLFYKNHQDSRLKGSGVGLAIAKKIMELHDGIITAESVLGEGSVFTCYFPKSGDCLHH